MNNQFKDPVYLRHEQYKDASNLAKRIALHERFSTNPTGWLAWVLAQLDLPESAAILEVGCGPGQLWRQNLSVLGPGWRIVASDFSTGMVREVVQNLQEKSCFYFACLDAQAIPFPDQTFDGVVANHMLYHVPSLDDALAEIARVLGPGGTLYASTNGEDHLREISGFVAEADGPGSSAGVGSFRWGISSFSLRSGMDKLRSHFGQVERRRYQDSLHVTDPEAIIDFIQSSSLFRLSQHGVNQLRDLLDERMRIDGAIDITKDTGIFVARRPHPRRF